MNPSILKFMNAKHNGQGALHWGRADIDGAPFRGAPILATEDEVADRVMRVADPHVRTFDLSLPEDNDAYLKVLDKIVNGWAKCVQPAGPKHLYLKMTTTDPATGTRSVDVKIKVHLEWVEFYMEDGKPMQSQRPMLGEPND